MSNEIHIPEIPIIKIGRHPDNDIVLEPKDISKFHAKLYVCSPTSFLIEDTQSKNGTFFQGFRVERKLVDINDEITIGTTILQIKNLIKFERKNNIVKNGLDYSYEFNELRKVYDDYPLLRKTCRERDKIVKMWSVIGGSTIAVASTLTGIGLLAIVSSAGLSMLIPTLVSTFLSTEEKLEILEKEYKAKYRCPNPDCQDSFGNKEWELLAKQKSCKKCKAIWVK
ncbi:MAG: FHA domain-containing protein [Cytophagaceae bacterium]|nr:FHA domain-containing protein [Cytophagaceae bacterium]